MFVELHVPTRNFVIEITFCLLFDIKALVLSYQTSYDDRSWESLKQIIDIMLKMYGLWKIHRLFYTAD